MPSYHILGANCSPVAHWGSFTGSVINVCGGSGPSPDCALYLRSMTLYNLGTVNSTVIPEGPDKQLFAALGNYASVLWNFKYSR